MSFTLPHSQKTNLLEQYTPHIEQVLNRVLDQGGEGDVRVRRGVPQRGGRDDHVGAKVN